MTTALAPSPLDILAGSDCVCGMDDSCCCPPTERALRRSISAVDIVFTSEQREWCLREIDRVEGYKREDYAGVITCDLARGVLDAWTDFCRDKGLL